MKIGHLAKRVHTGVRAAGAVNHRAGTRQALAHLHEQTLDRALVRLDLPSVKFRTIVGECELDILHRGAKRNPSTGAGAGIIGAVVDPHPGPALGRGRSPVAEPVRSGSRA